MLAKVIGAGLGIARLATMSSCQYFHDVVVPPHPTAAPQAWAGVYDFGGGGYVSLGPGELGAYYRTNSDTDTFLAVAAGYDPDGTEAVREYDAQWIQYCKGVDITDAQWAPDQVAQQPGGIGQTVSDGLYTYNIVRFDDAPTECPVGYSVDHIVFQWSAESWSYYGPGVGYTASGEIDYYPP